MVEEIWRTDPLTLREEVLDRDAMVAGLAEAAPMERVWMLATLGRVAEASDEGDAILREADNRFGPLLLLGYVRLRQFYWAGAASLQEEALQLARTPGEGGRRAVPGWQALV
ncbi:hypothetical protein [Arthrobacter sp. H14]|uniref:hypothetical protein n=1 Tax=Arthrobacter sp. H14 TaxID=1312959 RepID=UPI0004AE9082|nr:hypothetical protein [Arthrobacter sp. H14]